MLFPVLFQDEEQFLGTSKGEDGKQTAPSTAHNVVNHARETRLSLAARLVHLDAICRFHDEYMRRQRRRLGALEMAIALAREITCVQHTNPGDFDHEHGCPEHMTSVVAPEANALVLQFLMVVDEFNLLERLVEVLVAEEHLLGGRVADPDKVTQQELVDGLGRMCHEHAALEGCVLEEIWYGATMIKMEAT